MKMYVTRYVVILSILLIYNINFSSQAKNIRSDFDISIIIPVSADSSSSFLRNSLKSIYSELEREDVILSEEIIIAEVGSVDSITKRYTRSDTLALATEFYTTQDKKITTLKSSKESWKYSAAINAAVSKSTGRMIMILSDKTELLPNFFASLQKYLKNEENLLRNGM